SDSLGRAPMFNHVFLGTDDIEKSRAFYDATMGVLGYEGHPLPHGTVYPSATGSFIVAKPANGEAMCVSNGHTLGFTAKTMTRSMPGTRRASKRAEPTKAPLASARNRRATCTAPICAIPTATRSAS